MLFDSETGDPGDEVHRRPALVAQRHPGLGQVAHSSPAAWSNAEAASAGPSSLTAAAPIALPAGQPSYLFFQQWRVLDYDASGFYDGGTVEINGADAAVTWVNGPTQTINGFGNPAGAEGFGGDSRGYLASRLDLTPFAGTASRRGSR